MDSTNLFGPEDDQLFACLSDWPIEEYRDETTAQPTNLLEPEDDQLFPYLSNWPIEEYRGEPITQIDIPSPHFIHDGWTMLPDQHPEFLPAASHHINFDPTYDRVPGSPFISNVTSNWILDPTCLQTAPLDLNHCPVPSSGSSGPTQQGARHAARERYRISSDLWDAYKDEIYDLYILRNNTLKNVMASMEKRFCFAPG